MANASGTSGVVSGASSGSIASPSVGTQTSSDGAANDQARSPNHQTPADVTTDVPAEPEFELSNGKKYKRSEFEQRLKGLEKGFTQTSQKLAEREKKWTALDGALKRFGVSVEEFLQDPDAHFSRAAQDLIARQVDESMLDPKEREMNAREREIAEREQKIKDFEEKQEADREAAAVEEEADQIAQGLVPALQSAGLPANAKTVARVAEVMMAALRQRQIRLEPSEAAAYVAEQIAEEQKFVMADAMKSSPDALISWLGPEGVEVVRKHLLAQVKKPQQRPQPPSNVPRDTHTGQYIGWGDYQKTRRI